MLLWLPLLAAVTFASQGQDPLVASASRVIATRAAQPPVIDGRDDDAVWREAQPITGFQEWRPSEGGPPKLPTEAKIAYDAANMYVFVRAFDPHPDSIITVRARRDYFTPSDMIWLFLDSYHDRRTGYEFGVNPSGVKLDAQIYNDGNEDFAWDAVWDVATRVDSLGWTAEFRIPLSQLRYGRERTHTFGFTVDRDLYRYSQRVSWPLFRQSRAGFVSQLGEISGLDDLVAPRRLEAAPYLVTKNVSEFTAAGIGRSQDVTIGGDLKYRVASNLTLDATINPDFGQVEADPAVLNLTAFETFFQERRPFFVQGAGTFQFNVNCMAVNDCSTGEGLVYSRRIGRAPELAGVYSDTTSAAFTTILGATKLTGRLPGGLAIGALDAVTAHETGVGGVTIEPATNYGVLRLRQDLRKGESSGGGIITAVNRENDSWSSPYLHRSAYVGAADFRHRFPGGRYELSGAIDFSRVAGSAQAITSTQLDATHYYQRPDALRFDSTRTSLSGDAEMLQFGKVAGNVLFQSNVERRSPGFEINDLGYLQRADQIAWTTYCYDCARGGPAVRQDSYLAPWLGINGDDRKAIVPYLWFNWSRSNGGRSHNFSFSPELDFKIASRVTAELSANPRAADYDSRYQAYGDTAFTNNIGGFNFKQFRLNVVLRWEYRPGSTLFLVWSQGRRGSTGVEGARNFSGDLNDLFDLRPDNSFLVKLSYWINR